MTYNICIQGFLGKNHSWSLVNQNIARTLIKKGHNVDLCSTNGLEHFPEDLKPYLKDKITSLYDVQISYTSMKNFPYYLSHGNKNRFGIWAYEYYPALPPGFSKYYKFCDKILAPSNFARDIFLKNHIPPEHVKVIPHGINPEEYQNKTKWQDLKNDFDKVIYINIGQNHLRKNIPNLLQSLGIAFSKKDKVCVIAKISFNNNLNSSFEVNVREIYNNFEKKFKDHVTIKLITEYVPDIISLYNSCDIVYTLSFAEAFYLPALESFAANKMVISPRYGGQLDFLNDDNSILIDGKIIRADMKMQYWIASPYNQVFEPNVDEAAEKLNYAVNNYDKLMERFSPNMEKVAKEYTWDKVADQILEMVV